MKVIIYDIVNSVYCVADDDASKVFDVIYSKISNKEKIVVSFDKVEIITSAFLNIAIGQLFVKLDEDDIKPFLKFDSKGMTNHLKVLIKRVIDTAKLFKTNPELFDPNINKED